MTGHVTTCLRSHFPPSLAVTMETRLLSGPGGIEIDIVPNSEAAPSSWPYCNMQSPSMPSVCGYPVDFPCPRILDTVLSMLSLALYAVETQTRPLHAGTEWNF